MVDNTLVQRRLAMRLRNGKPQVGMGSMGDVLHPFRYQHIKTQGGAGQGEEGPLSYPTLPGDIIGDTVEDRLDRIIWLLEDLPAKLSLEARTKFLIPPRERTDFVATNGLQPLAAAPATLAIAAFQVTEQYTGALMKIGTQVVPAAAAAAIQWSLRISGFDHPNFSQLVLQADTLDEPYNFGIELTQSSLVELVATNTALPPVNVAGVLIGYTELMALYKPWGGDPASGIG